MFRVEFADSDTHEILREVMYEKEDAIKEIISMLSSKNTAENPTYLIDKELRSLDAEYVTYSTFNENGITVYKLFFKVQPSEKQFKIMN